MLESHNTAEGVIKLDGTNNGMMSVDPDELPDTESVVDTDALREAAIPRGNTESVFIVERRKCKLSAMVLSQDRGGFERGTPIVVASFDLPSSDTRIESSLSTNSSSRIMFMFCTC